MNGKVGEFCYKRSVGTLHSTFCYALCFFVISMLCLCVINEWLFFDVLQLCCRLLWYGCHLPLRLSISYGCIVALCALILSKTLALYKSFTYLLTYLLKRCKIGSRLLLLTSRKLHMSF